MCRERFLPGRVRSQGDSDESRKRPWGMIESDMMRPCETNQRSLVVSFAVSKPHAGTFPSLRDPKYHLLSSGAGALVALWRARNHGA